MSAVSVETAREADLGGRGCPPFQSRPLAKRTWAAADVRRFSQEGWRSGPGGRRMSAVAVATAREADLGGRGCPPFQSRPLAKRTWAAADVRRFSRDRSRTGLRRPSLDSADV